VLGRSVRHRGSGGIRDRGVCRRKNPLGANLDRDELHDDLQFAGSDLPDRLCRAWYGADQRRYYDQQCDCECVVPDQLLDPATHLSDDLRQTVAFAVIGPASNCRD
jgi:hypothetical protein